MFGLGISELVVIAIIVLFIFGAKRLPEIGKGLGESIREFKSIKNEIHSDNKNTEKQNIEEANKDNIKENNMVEDVIHQRLLDQVPGVREVRLVKEKADKIKELI